MRLYYRLRIKPFQQGWQLCEDRFTSIQQAEEHALSLGNADHSQLPMVTQVLEVREGASALIPESFGMEESCL